MKIAHKYLNVVKSRKLDIYNAIDDDDFVPIKKKKVLKLAESSHASTLYSFCGNEFCLCLSKFDDQQNEVESIYIKAFLDNCPR